MAIDPNPSRSPAKPTLRPKAPKGVPDKSKREAGGNPATAPPVQKTPSMKYAERGQSDSAPSIPYPGVGI